MPAATIIALLLQNAPAIITEGEDLIAWLGATYTRVMGVIDLPADQITEEMIVASLDRIKAEDAKIEKIR